MSRFDPHPQRRPALISGASSGIGTATAFALAELGHPVALGARRVDECEAIAEKIRQNGGEAFAGHLDVTDTASVDAFTTAAEDALGPLEILVSGAGDLRVGRVHEMDPDTFLAQLNVHLAGAQRLIARLVPHMIGRQRGDVVLIGSDVVAAPRPRSGAYVAAKSGLEAMAEQMRMELEGTGVRTSVVRPGATQTSMGMDMSAEDAGPLLEDWIKWGFARHPYFLRAADIAAAITTTVSTPRGAHVTLIEVQPEAPLIDPAAPSREA
ncbi:SDR family oxidoreductase [Tomitella biformata]|uniref:SDR family oxidoreductase n=1 Tax=Tomitella biformata TaxID=630403 RepID=UPI00046681F4|nr:SDR family oxidoreductase [Tomitella biformata]